jgi:hypothetical protein
MDFKRIDSTNLKYRNGQINRIQNCGGFALHGAGCAGVLMRQVDQVYVMLFAAFGRSSRQPIGPWPVTNSDPPAGN